MVSGVGHSNYETNGSLEYLGFKSSYKRFDKAPV